MSEGGEPDGFRACVEELTRAGFSQSISTVACATALHDAGRDTRGAGGAPPDVVDRAWSLAFDGFYREQFPRLVAYLQKRGFCPATSQDAAQTAMIKAHTRWSTITDSPSGWVRTVAYRAACDTVEAHPFEQLTDEPDEGADRDERSRRPVVGAPASWEPYRALLDELGDNARAALILHLDGYDPTEIATILGTRTSTARSHVRHGRRRLQRLLCTEPAAKLLRLCPGWSREDIDALRARWCSGCRRRHGRQRPPARPTTDLDDEGDQESTS